MDPRTEDGERIGMSRYCDHLEHRIAELEAACRTALHAYARVSRVRLPGDVAGDLVHAREVLKSVFKE